MPARNTRTLRSLYVATMICTITNAQAASAPTTDDSAFLACASHSDRGQRIACLEDALENAVAARDALTAADSPAAPDAPGPNAAPAADTTPSPAPADERSLLERVRAFGQDVALSTDDNGTERLHDSIAALESRNGLWIVTLSSGQVWRQEVPRTLNLREGDAIEIYRDGIGNGYRLATPRLSGFIRVERLR